jgi:hypothetical protein
VRGRRKNYLISKTLYLWIQEEKEGIKQRTKNSFNVKLKIKIKENRKKMKVKDFDIFKK